MILHLLCCIFWYMGWCQQTLVVLQKKVGFSCFKNSSRETFFASTCLLLYTASNYAFLICKAYQNASLVWECLWQHCLMLPHHITTQCSTVNQDFFAEQPYLAERGSFGPHHLFLNLIMAFRGCRWLTVIIFLSLALTTLPSFPFIWQD